MFLTLIRWKDGIILGYPEIVNKTGKASRRLIFSGHELSAMTQHI